MKIYKNPTRDEINACDSIPELEKMLEDVGISISKMETDIQHSERRFDKDWSRRVLAALGHYRHSERVLVARIRDLKLEKDAEPPVRERKECNPLSLELLDNTFVVDIPAITTLAECRALIAQLVERINALMEDREDEVTSVIPQDRDVVWLANANAAIRRANVLRQDLQMKLGELNRADKAAKQAETQRIRERAFIDVVRDRVDRDTFMSFWTEVDRALAQ